MSGCVQENRNVDELCIFSFLFFCLLFLLFFSSLSIAGTHGVSGPAESITGNYTISWGRVPSDYNLPAQDHFEGVAHIREYFNGEFVRRLTPNSSSRNINVVVDKTGEYRYDVVWRIRTCYNPFECNFDFGYENKSIGSHTVRSILHIDKPGNVSYQNLSHANQFADNNNNFVLRWGEASFGADAFQVQRRREGGNWESLYSGKNQSLTISDQGNHAAWYRVRACTANYSFCGAFLNSNLLTVAVPPSVPASINGIPATDADGKYTTSWSKPNGRVTGYTLQQRRNNGNWTTIDSGSDTQHSINNSTDGTYQFRVRACNQVGSFTQCSGFRESSNSIVAITPGVPPSLKAGDTSASRNFTASWEVTSGRVDSYQVFYRNTNSTQWIGAGSSNADARSQSVLVPSDGTYQLRIRACNLESTFNSCGAYRHSDNVTVATRAPKPTGFREFPRTNTSDNVTLKWSAVANNHFDHYEVFRRTNGAGSWVDLGNTVSNEFNVAGLNDGSYEFRVRACNVEGSFEACSDFLSSPSMEVRRIPGVPSKPRYDLTATGSLSVEWGGGVVESGVYYQLQYTQVDVPPQESHWVLPNAQSHLNQASATSVALSDGSVLFRVRACKTAWSCSAFSAAGERATVRNPLALPSDFQLPTENQGTLNYLYSTNLRVSSKTRPYFLLYGRQAISSEWTIVERFDIENIPGRDGQVHFQARGLVGGGWDFAVRVCNQFNWACSALSPMQRVTVMARPEWAHIGGAVPEPVFSHQDVPFNDYNGPLPGSGATNGGTATYLIPIQLPPGRNGFEPTVALNYSSKGGNGIAGVGWSLSATSAIGACSSTYAQDGMGHNRDHQKWCLDGQRLMLVSGNRNDGTFRLEHDQEVIVRSSTTGGHREFTATYPNGHIRRFGHSSNHNFDDGLNFYLRQWESSNAQNVVHYDYERVGQTQEVRLKRIHYTGTGATRGDRSVEFLYQSRSDTLHGVRFGKVQQRRSRLYSIRTFYNGTQVRGYGLRYTRSEASGRSLLSSIRTCGYNGPNQQCTEYTNVEWQDQAPRYQLELLTDNQGNELHPGPSAALIRHLPQGDRNGDGVSDWPGRFISAEGQSTPNNFTLKNCVYSLHGNRRRCVEGDFNQDGRTDSWRVQNGMLQIGYTSADASRTSWSGRTDVPLDAIVDNEAVRYSQDFLFAVNDYNGDGWLDIIVHRNNNRRPTVHVYLHTQNNANPYIAQGGRQIFTYPFEGAGCGLPDGFGPCLFQNELQPTGDMDGNGLPDFIQLSKPNFHVETIMVADVIHLTKVDAAGNISLQAVPLDFVEHSPVSAYSSFIDVNGDGLADWIGWKSTTDGQLYLAINQGEGRFGELQSLGVSLSTKAVILNGDIFGETYSEVRVPRFVDAIQQMDIDGDGRVELLVPGRIEVEGCHTLLERNQHRWFCGSELHGTYQVTKGARVYEESIPNYADHNIYQYRALHFQEDAHGNFSAREENTNLYGGANNTFTLDAFGNGLTDMVFTYGCANSNCRMNSPSVGSPLSGLKEGVYINRNYGSTEVSSPTFADYEAVDAVKAIDNGAGIRYEWDHLPLNSQQVPNLYRTDPGYVDDNAHIHFSSSMQVVHEMRVSNGVGGNNRTRYQYEGAVYNNQGRGFAGFRTIRVFDDADGLVTQTRFHQKFPFTGRVEQIETYTQGEFPSGEPLSTASHLWVVNDAHRQVWGSQGLVKVFDTRADSETFDLHSHESVSRTVRTINNGDVDQYGNVARVTSTTLDAVGTYVAINEADFTPANDQWPHRYASQTVTNRKVGYRSGQVPAMGGSNIDKVVTTLVDEWDTTHRVPRIVTVRGGTASAANDGESTTTTTHFNAFGLPTRVDERGNVLNDSGNASAQTRSTRYTYSKDGHNAANDGYFVLETATPVGGRTLVTHTTSNPHHGRVETTTSPAGVSTAQYFDPLEKPFTVITDGEAYQRVRFLKVDASVDTDAPPYARYLRQTFQQGAPSVKEYVDALGRVLRTVVEGFDGSPIYQDVTYTARGHQSQQTNAYYSVFDRLTTTHSDYDALGRVGQKVTEQTNGRLSIRYTYNGLTTSAAVTADVGHNIEVQRTYNSRDQLISTVDAEGGRTRYAYDANGNVIAIEDAQGNVIRADYDNLSRKRWVNDPNQGRTNFVYNRFGEPEREQDANGQVIHYDYDTLGRLTRRNSAGSVATFEWDTQRPGLMTAQSESGVRYRYEYDFAGRMVAEHTEIGGDTFTTRHQFAQNTGHPLAMVYPNGLQVAYEYNDLGYLTTEKNAASDYIYREVTEQDARGMATLYGLGAAYQSGFALTGEGHYSGHGQMLETRVSRGNVDVHHWLYPATDHDSYGNLLVQYNRSEWTGALGVASGEVNAQETFVYDRLHRLSSAQLLADGDTTRMELRYDAVGNITQKSDYASNYEYARSNGAGPNAVTAVQLADGSRETYGYDRKGNRINRNGVQEITYNVHNKPTRINKNGATLTFAYGPDLARYQQVRTVAGETTTTTYVGKHYQLERSAQGTAWKAFIGDVAIVSQGADNQYKLRFTLRDRLGSATTLTDDNGQVTARRHFDPFGKPRQGNWAELDIAQLGENPFDSDMATRR
ncbi:fibronectin type III domain-containing protein, partial [Marinibactrum halimedae]